MSGNLCLICKLLGRVLSHSHERGFRFKRDVEEDSFMPRCRGLHEKPTKSCKLSQILTALFKVCQTSFKHSEVETSSLPHTPQGKTYQCLDGYNLMSTSCSRPPPVKAYCFTPHRAIYRTVARSYRGPDPATVSREPSMSLHILPLQHFPFCWAQARGTPTTSAPRLICHVHPWLCLQLQVGACFVDLWILGGS